MDTNIDVTVVMPVRNEGEFIERSVASVLRQSYPQDKIKIIIIDGMSTDQTPQVLARLVEEHDNILVLNNPRKIVPYALNAALKTATGKIIVRVDGHCEIAPDYVEQCVRHLSQDDVECVGGPIETIGETPAASVIALAMSVPFGVGNSAFRTVKGRTMLVDTVAFPAYTRAAIDRVGPFDEELVRNQDDEYNFRLRKLGGKVLLTPDIRSIYYSRSSFQSLWRQYFQYGYWKVRVMQKHPHQMSLRQFIPPAFTLSLLTLTAASFFTVWGRILLGVCLGTYLLASLVYTLIAAVSIRKSWVILLPPAFWIIHIGYGLGFLTGLVKFANRWSKQDSVIKPVAFQR